MSKRAEIYRAVLEMGRAIRFTGAWQYLQPSPTFVELTMPAADMAGELQKKFELRDLLPSGVLLSCPGDEPRLNPLLTEPPRALFPVSRTADQDVDLVGNGSRTMSGDWTLRAIRRDCRTEASIVKLGCRLIVVPELVDAAICLALGLRVVPATALHRLAGKGLPMLKQQLALKSRPPSGDTIGHGLPSADSGSSPQPVAWVLADWRIAELSTADHPLIHEIRDDLARIDEVLSLRLRNACVWKPSPEEILRLRFCIERGRTIPLVVKSLRECLERSSKPLVVATTPPPNPSAAFAEDMRRMVTGIPQEGRDAPATSYWTDFHAKLDQDVIEPIRAQARATRDPIRREKLTVLADLTAVARPALQRLIHDFVRPDGGGPPRELSDDELRPILATLDRMLALAKSGL